MIRRKESSHWTGGLRSRLASHKVLKYLYIVKLGVCLKCKSKLLSLLHMMTIPNLRFKVRISDVFRRQS